MCVCSCARSACTPPLLARLCGVAVCLGSGFGCAPPGQAGVLGCVCVCVPATLVPCHSWLGCGVRVCVWAQDSAAPRNSWLGCWGVCVFVCPLRLYPATPGPGVWCAGWLCVPGLGCRLRPASPCWGVGVCVCSCARSACSMPLLAGVCGAGVCFSSGFGCTRQSWLGLWGVCVVVYPLRLYPATPGWDVGVCVCVLGFGFGLRSATPGWGIGVCVCSCARYACPQPLLAGVCGVGVCVWAPGSAAPRHSWYGCSGVCVVVCPLRLYPATPGWGVLCGCVCLGSGFGRAMPLLAGMLGMCVFVCPLRLYPATPGWDV